jgi:hypothetical protein
LWLRTAGSVYVVPRGGSAYLRPSRCRVRLGLPCSLMLEVLPWCPILCPFLPSGRTHRGRTSRRYHNRCQMERKLCIQVESRCCRCPLPSIERLGHGVAANACDHLEHTIRTPASWSCSPAWVFRLPRSIFLRARNQFRKLT